MTDFRRGRPLIAAVLQTDAHEDEDLDEELVAADDEDDDDPDDDRDITGGGDAEKGARYSVYCEAYGIEMQLDDEWPVDLVVLTAPAYLDVVVDETDVLAAENVSGGVVGPLDDLEPLSTDITGAVLLGADDPKNDELPDLAREALDAGGRVLLCVRADAIAELATTLDLIGEVPEGRLALVVVRDVLDETASMTDAEATQAAHARVRALLADHELGAVPLLAASLGADALPEVLAGDDVDGALLTEADYDEFGDLLELLEALADRT